MLRNNFRNHSVCTYCKSHNSLDGNLSKNDEVYYFSQDPPWKTHIWEKDRESSGNGPRTPSRKFRFKEIA
ncbi:hypothetical protein NPIL_204221, partial [Nephila pilipes]